MITYPTQSELVKMRHALLAWFTKNARNLPWRLTRDPYYVWVSEIMLQQTQVSTVIEYYLRFMKAFPNVETLAYADEERVLRLWEGLGYYRRARQLHSAAKKIVAEFGGKFPDSLRAAESLPGVGRYTAGAVLSLALGKRTPVLEANTVRLHARLLGLDMISSSSEAQKILWEAAERFLPKKMKLSTKKHISDGGKKVCSPKDAVSSFTSATRPKSHTTPVNYSDLSHTPTFYEADPGDPGPLNQALMELGSLICTPQKPGCVECPLKKWCMAFKMNRSEEIPRLAPKPDIQLRHETAILIHRNEHPHKKFCVLRYAPGQRWAGLWDFPRTVVESEHPQEIQREITERITEMTGLNVLPGPVLFTIRHGVTIYRISLDVRESTLQEECSTAQTHTPAGGEIRWVTLSELEHYPLSSTGRKVVKYLETH